MLQRPPFLLTVTILAFVLLSILLIVSPLPDDFWWPKIDPLGYSIRILRMTEGFALPPTDPAPCPFPFRLGVAWQTVAARSNADSIFRHLFLRARPAGRLYALIGLHSLHASGLASAVHMARQDTARVMIWDRKTRRTIFIPLDELASDDTLQAWGSALESATPAAMCAA